MTKISLMALMRRMMINCEEATYLTVKASVEGVSMKDVINLKMHRAGCPHCRKYFEQNKILDRSIRKHISHAVETRQPLHRLSDSGRSKLQKLITSKIQSA
ncbi:MAG: hypothetical protein JW894_10785 [Bacteroidales bacterium]|nr:hypothetical protein [Bacteroidales bacterium]